MSETKAAARGGMVNRDNAVPRRARALFLGSTYAGHSTRFANLERRASADGRLDCSFKRVSGWHHGGLIERLPGPRAVRGRARATFEAAAFAQLPRPDVIWTSASEVLAPYIWAQAGPLRRPLVLDLDATRDQLESLAPHYKGRPPKSGAADALGRWRERILWSRVSMFTPWSNWAADSLRSAGVGEERIRVMPPGVDLERWAPVSRSTDEGRPLRLLFVGGDFVRKGGELLLELMRSDAGEDLELDIVTRDSVVGGANVRVHRFEQGDAGLTELFRKADLFVMPSLGECFGIATVEAMATGMPALVSNVGGSSDIVDHGTTGWIVEPTVEDLRAALTAVLARRAALAGMGQRARAVVESRFDARRNDRAIVDLVVELAGRRSEQSTSVAADR